MPTENNKLVVMQFQQALAAGQAGAALALMAPEATWWIPGAEPGGVTMTKEAMAPVLHSFLGVFRQMPGFEVLSITAEGDRVVLQQSARGGMTHGGAAYGNDYLILFELRDGMIMRIREYLNPILSGPIAAELQGHAG